MEIFTFLYYANEESDDVIGGSTKTVQHTITHISRNIKAVFFRLGTRNQHYERRKMTPVVLLPRQQLCRWSCFIKTKIPRFYLKQGSSTPNTLMGRVNTIWEPCVFGARTLGSISAALSCLVYPPREETAGRVSSKACL